MGAEEAREAVNQAIDEYRAALFHPNMGVFFNAQVRLSRALDELVEAARQEGPAFAPQATQEARQ
jgi:hypothetical protein